MDGRTVTLVTTDQDGRDDSTDGKMSDRMQHTKALQLSSALTTIMLEEATITQLQNTELSRENNSTAHAPKHTAHLQVTYEKADD